MSERIKALAIINDSSIRELVKMLLETEGYMVAVSYDLNKFGGLLDEIQPDIALARIREAVDAKPLITDLEAMRSRKGFAPPLIFMTTSSSIEEALNGLGVDGVIKEPFELDDFLEHIAKTRESFNI